MDNSKRLFVSVVLLVVFFCECQGFPTAQTQQHTEKRHPSRVPNHIQEKFLIDFQAHLKYKDNGCECHEYSCFCCVRAEVKKIHLNHTVCVVLDYLPKELGVDVKLNLDNQTLFTEKVSLTNPPPMCAGIPHLEKYASVCLVFYNITWDQKAGGCIKLDAKLAGVTLEEINIGCFYYPLDARALINELIWQEHVLSELKKSFKKFQEKDAILAKQMILEVDV